MKSEENFGMTATNQNNKWRLAEIISGICDIDKKYNNVSIKGITLDSRKVEDGFLFAALKGAKVDGSKFIDDAIAAGAVAIICDEESAKAQKRKSASEEICIIKCKNPRRALSLIAACFYQKQPDVIAAVTGTNGKTSTVHFCREIWKSLGRHSASVGTIGISDSDGRDFHEEGAVLTTPDPVVLHKIIADITDAGVTNMAMEASSHGLDQCRLDGVRVKIGAFTNLSRDHLDYHGNFENYLNAKMRLFNEVMEDGGIVILNADIPEFEKLVLACKERGHKIISYGKYNKDSGKNYIDIFDIIPTAHGQQVSFEVMGKVYNVNIPLIGEFQAYNLLCALGVVVASGGNLDDAVHAMEHVSCVPGRMEKVKCDKAIYVDYSHTPDALQKALEVLRLHTKGKLWVVFGCGGDRDKGKRSQMGAVAAKLVDKIIVTDDNPRTENPDSIRAEIMKSCNGAEEIGDRRKAIEKAIADMADEDVLLIAGKGHEKTQIIGSQALPFDDVKVAGGR